MNFQHSIDRFWHRVEKKKKKKNEQKKVMRENKTDETILSIES